MSHRLTPDPALSAAPEADPAGRTHFVLTVGLTGGIATGKSTVGRVFAELGATVIDADDIAHRLIDRGARGYEPVVEAFGSDILRPDASIDRSRLGRLVFSDPGRRRTLERILHPLIREEELRQMVQQREAGGRIVVTNAALLIETGSHRGYHRVVVVFCDVAIQIARIVRRDRFTEEEARRRIDSQMPTAEKLRVAHYRIDTTAGFRQTESRARAVFRHLQHDLQAIASGA